jgi:hypothetical protein
VEPRRERERFFTVSSSCIQTSHMYDRGSGIRFPVGAGNFSLLHGVGAGSGAHPVSCPVGTGSCFMGGGVAEAWGWPFAST